MIDCIDGIVNFVEEISNSSSILRKTIAAEAEKEQVFLF